MEMKPCPVPWCDREQAPQLMVNRRYDNSKSYRVVCLRCCSTDFFDTEEEATTQWNTRSDQPVSVEERLPEVHEHVLVWESGIWRHAKYIGTGEFAIDGVYANIILATSWLPMPPAPKEG